MIITTYTNIYKKIPIFTDTLIEDNENGVAIKRSSREESGGLSYLFNHMCGIPDKNVNASVDIQVNDRLHFLKESSKRWRAVTNAFAIFLVAVISFLIGYFR